MASAIVAYRVHRGTAFIPPVEELGARRTSRLGLVTYRPRGRYNVSVAGTGALADSYQ